MATGFLSTWFPPNFHSACYDLAGQNLDLWGGRLCTDVVLLLPQVWLAGLHCWKADLMDFYEAQMSVFKRLLTPFAVSSFFGGQSRSCNFNRAWVAWRTPHVGFSL